MALTPDELNLIQQAIIQFDPHQSYVSIDVTRKKVSYSREIVQHETIHDYVGDEEPCRALIVAWLCTAGGYHPTNIELEKRYSIGRPQEGAELDILINRPDGMAFLLIEVKAPEEFLVDQEKFIKGQLFGIAPLEEGTQALAYVTVAVAD